MENYQCKNQTISYKVTATTSAELRDEAVKVNMSLSEYCSLTMDLSRNAIKNINEPSEKEKQLALEIDTIEGEVLEIKKKLNITDEKLGVELRANHTLSIQLEKSKLDNRKIAKERDAQKKQADQKSVELNKVRKNIDNYAEKKKFWGPISDFATNELMALKE